MTLPLIAPRSAQDRYGVTWSIGTAGEVHSFLAEHHYLGPLPSGGGLVIVGHAQDTTVACQVWRRPTARHLPTDGTWLELSRWCITPDAGPSAGSRCHRYAVPLLREQGARTLVSYSDPSRGHTGALYRACNWQWAPVWHRLRPPPTGNGAWAEGKRQHVKDRWVFHVSRHDPHRAALIPTDLAAVRHWRRTAPPTELRWAEQSEYMRYALGRCQPWTLR